MRTRFVVTRAVFIGLTLISGIFWLVWMFDINAYTKFQILWGSIDMLTLRRLLAGICILSICGVALTLHFSKKRYYAFAVLILAAVYGIGLLVSVKMAPDTEYYSFHNDDRELIVREENDGERWQAVFYERKNPAVIEYLGNMDYYGKDSAFASGNCNINWEEDGQVIVSVLAQFDHYAEDENEWSDESYMETRETKEQIFYVGKE